MIYLNRGGLAAFDPIGGVIFSLFGAKQKDIGLTEANRIINELESEDESREMDVLPVLGKVASDYRDLAEGRDIVLEFRPSHCVVCGGSLLLELFSHIVENAIIHSGGERVVVKVKRGSDEGVVIVEDSGKGISDSEKDKIFRRFWTTNKKICSGLGLYLAKLIAESYGGYVELEDSELGGARFEVHLRKV